MKRFLVLGIGLLAATLASGTANAAPVYYTFEGLISGADDGAGIVADAGLGIGSSVSYTWLVDTEAAGYATYYNGSTWFLPDDFMTDSFYVDLVSAAPIQEKNGGYAPYQTALHTATTNYGVDYLVDDDPAGVYLELINGGSGTSFTYMMAMERISDWAVGDTGFWVNTQAFDDIGNRSSISSNFNFTLTNISDTAPGTSSASVPEPGTLLLLGSGVAGLGMVRRFRNKKA